MSSAGRSASFSPHSDPGLQSGPSRILLTADTVGGVWTYALDLIRALPRVEFALATMGRALSADQAAEAGALPNARVHESAHRLEWMDDPWDDVRAAGEWLLRLEGEFRPDVVHLNGLVHGGLPFRAPRLVVVHSDVLSWWRAVKGEDAPPAWDRYADAVRASLQAADLVAAPSRAMLAEATRLYGPFGRTAVLTNGRAGFAPGEKEPFVFAAGRAWDEAKNVAALTGLDLPWPVVVAGEGSPMGRLTTSEVRDRMARAAIYALPARYEPFGLSVLEAALSGCALVLGDIPSLRENWDGAARFVDPDDRDALRAALAGLIEDAGLRGRLGAAARARGAEFSLERLGEAYAGLYRGMVGSLATR